LAHATYSFPGGTVGSWSQLSVLRKKPPSFWWGLLRCLVLVSYERGLSITSNRATTPPEHLTSMESVAAIGIAVFKPAR
jgi:hypothetical protein